MPKLPKLPSLPELPKITPKDLLGATAGAVFSHGEAIVTELVGAARTRKEHYKYDIDLVRSLVNLAGSGMTLYLIYKRRRAAVGVSVATTAITCGLSFVSRFTKPEERDKPTHEKALGALLDNLGALIGSIPLVFASTTPRDLPFKLDFAPRDPSVPFTMAEHTRNLVSLYATYTIIGHWLEMAFCQLIRLGLVGGDYDRSNTMLWDWWLHPFPAEGIAGIMIAVALTPFRDWLLKLFDGKVLPALTLSFIANQIVCTSIDYGTGMVANRNYELWDYRDMPFNFQGQVCLQNSLVYSAAATFVAWVVYPLRDKLLRRIPADATNLAFFAFLPCYAFLSLIYFVELKKTEEQAKEAGDVEGAVAGDVALQGAIAEG